MSKALSSVVERKDDRRLTAAGMEHFPALIVRVGGKAGYRFLEFFTAQIRNRNTRRAYAEPIRQFFDWCEGHGLELTQLNSVIRRGFRLEHDQTNSGTLASATQAERECLRSSRGSLP